MIIIINKWALEQERLDLSPLRGHGQRPRPPEFRVTPLASVCNPEANPVRVTTKYHDMTSRNNRCSCHSGRRADKQGPRFSVWNQAEIEKYATGTNSPQQVLEELRAEDTLHSGPRRATTSSATRARRKNTNELGKSILE